MGYYVSEYLNELYSEKKNKNKLGKYEIYSNINANENGFFIEIECKELNIKVEENLGIDIKLSAFPDYYDEINNAFEEIAKEIFEQCKHKNIKTFEDETILCNNCGILYSIYDEEAKMYDIKEINWGYL